MIRSVIFALLLLPLGLRAQLTISGAAGIGTFKMDDFHSLQTQILSQLPVEGKITSSFPSYLFYQGSVKWISPAKNVMGLSFEYGSTGGRIYYSDYSGTLYSDQRLHYYQVNINFGMMANLPRNYFLELDLKPGITLSRLEMADYQNIGGLDFAESINVKSINIILQPTLSAIRRWRNIGFQLMGGYHFTINAGKLHPKGNRDVYLVDTKSEKVNANWSGVRLGFGIIGYIKNKKRDELATE
jgi:hypothetical protein